MAMNVFIDTNILLKFFHFNKDQLEALTNVFASHKHGAAKVYLTRQVCDEFKRNREAKIKDALKKFREGIPKLQLPSFMRAYKEYEQIISLSDQLQKEVENLNIKADKDIAEHNLEADILIADILDKSKIIEIEDALFELAKRRVALGNPPGKVGSMGDAINWTILMSRVPDGEDLHIISEDGDFFSILDSHRVNPFLADEWKRTKNSSVRVYRSLSPFMTEHFDGVAFSYDKEKEELIENLYESGSFANSHHLIDKLEKFKYFSLQEVEKILGAAGENSQFGHITGDNDVVEFLMRVAVPRKDTISNPVFLKLLEQTVEWHKLK